MAALAASEDNVPPSLSPAAAPPPSAACPFSRTAWASATYDCMALTGMPTLMLSARPASRCASSSRRNTRTVLSAHASAVKCVVASPLPSENEWKSSTRSCERECGRPRGREGRGSWHGGVPVCMCTSVPGAVDCGARIRTFAVAPRTCTTTRLCTLCSALMCAKPRRQCRARARRIASRARSSRFRSGKRPFPFWSRRAAGCPARVVHVRAQTGAERAHRQHPAALARRGARAGTGGRACWPSGRPPAQRTCE